MDDRTGFGENALEIGDVQLLSVWECRTLLDVADGNWRGLAEEVWNSGPLSTFIVLIVSMVIRSSSDLI